MVTHSNYEDVSKMLGNLHEELLGRLLLPTAAAPLYAVLILNLLLEREPYENISVSLWLIGSCLLAYRLKARWPRVAAYVYVFGLAGAVLALTWLLSAPASTALLPILILITIAVLNTPSALVVAVVATGVILATVEQRQEPNSAVIAPLTAVWLTFFAAWLSNLTWMTSIEWAWNSYCQARTATAEAQRHRGELMRLYKVVDEAYYRLERSNVQLARARDEAEEARRIKQQFVANVSHELRTPLNIIIGFSEALALSPESYGVRAIPGQLMGDINRIYRSARHLKSLIDDVLDLSQIDARHMPLIIEQSSLSQIILEATDMLRSIVLRKGLALSLELPEALPPVLLDRLRIRQVLLNLLSNAIRFTDAGGITVSVALHADKLQVSVTDTGPGIAPEDLERVFEEFQQLDSSLNKRYDGTGLGLALSRRFVELHGGQLWAESEIGRGSRFHLTLPLIPKGEAPGRFRKSGPSISAHVEARVGRTVLVATEEPMVVNFLKRYLHDYQVKSIPSRDLAEAIETYLPQAVIVGGGADMRVGEGSPLVTARQAGVPVISCPLPDPVYLSQILEVDCYMVKPITHERLLSLLAGYGERVNRVLIVDDDAQLAELMARIVRAAPRPYTVEIACGGQEGLARMQAFLPDLVLLDLMMPELDGLSLLQFMRADEQLRQVSVVLITARDLPRPDIRLPGQNSIRVEGSTNFTLTEVVNCLQAVLDVLPLAGLNPAPQPGLAAAPASLPAS
jgi:signal transduction histidine kinase/CheY-like chemotaxis protein